MPSPLPQFSRARLLIEREIPYDDWLKNAASGKYRWLKRGLENYTGDVTVGLFGDNIPKDGFWVTHRPIGSAFSSLLEVVAPVIPDYARYGGAVETTFDNEIILNNATLIVAEAGSNEVIQLYSPQPYSTLRKDQLRVALFEFDIKANPDVPWGSSIGNFTKTVALSDYFNRRGPAKTRVARLRR